MQEKDQHAIVGFSWN